MRTRLPREDDRPDWRSLAMISVPKSYQGNRLYRQSSLMFTNPEGRETAFRQRQPVIVQRRYASMNGSSLPASTSIGFVVFKSVRVSFTNCSG